MKKTGDEDNERKIDCFRCCYFYVTWDKDFPRGCKALKFKSKEVPCMVVHRSSGVECLMFRPKDDNI